MSDTSHPVPFDCDRDTNLLDRRKLSSLFVSMSKVTLTVARLRRAERIVIIAKNASSNRFLLSVWGPISRKHIKKSTYAAATVAF